MSDWESLLEPIEIGRLRAKNRVEAAPTLINLAHADQSASRELIEFYRAQARGGAGIITVHETVVDSDRAINNPLQLNLGSDFYIPALSEVAEAIKSYGALASIQLNHGGRQAVAELNQGRNPIGPSPAVGLFTEDRRRGEAIVEEMTLEMIDEVVEHFGAAALRAKRAGFDMVMVHAGHGWLISQFVSPVINMRNDDYGNSLPNRVRFALRVADSIREHCGADFPIEWRMSASDLVAGGLEIGDAIEYARLMQDKVDAFQVSAGIIGEPRTYPYTHPAVYLPHGENLERAAQISKAVDKPVGVVGAILDLDEAGRWVSAGKIDFVALCRGLLADSALPKKTFQARKQDIVPCIRCNECVIRGAHGLTMRCAVNPWSGREEYYRCLPPPAVRKKVVVAGGGPAGMEAALLAASRGHEVVLFEKTARLGGNLWISSAPPFKDDWKRFLQYLLRQVERSSVKVRLSAEATPDLICAEQPDELVVAIGAEPAWPVLPGIENPMVAWAGSLGGTPVSGASVVVAGDGGMGREAALWLASTGKRVCVVEIPGGSSDDRTVNFVNASVLQDKLEEHGVVVRKGDVLERVLDGAVIVRQPNGGECEITTDAVIVAPNLQPLSQSVDRLKGLGQETYVIGDCQSPRILFNAVHEGFQAALEM